jgi:hypothetical protein
MTPLQADGQSVTAGLALGGLVTAIADGCRAMLIVPKPGVR